MVSHYKVLIKHIHNQLVIDQSILPMGCKIRNGQCLKGNQKVMWIPPSRNCPLEKVKELQLVTGNRMKINMDNKVVLCTLAEILVPGACGTRALLTTQYPNLFLTRKHKGWVQMEGDIDLAKFIEA